MAWIAIDENGIEYIYKSKPVRMKYSRRWIGKFISSDGYNEIFENSIELPAGTIKKLIDRELKWDDEPVELK